MRIIGGSAGGRRLSVPPRGTRPTSDRVRESLFSSLDALLGGWSGVRVLDLYAGSGALGLEALSRGATEAVLVERDRGSARIIEANATSVAVPGARVVCADVDAWSAREADAAYDVVFCDPPYAVPTEAVRSLLRGLGQRGWLAPDAVAVVERDARDADEPWPEGEWEPLRRRDFGDTALWYGRHLGSEPL
ncbi:MAG: 16S rRNA (guanine(966)-N(2))-methyltransferase RsmD [Actinomycetota bacterium]